MAFLRFLAWPFLLVATVALVGDITHSANHTANAVTSAHSYWKIVSPQSLVATTAFIQRSLHPWLWDPLALRVLLLPAWLLIGSVGVILAVLGRKKRRVNIFAN